MLGSDLTQADIQAEYTCVAMDTPSPSIKLTTDGMFLYLEDILNVLFAENNLLFSENITLKMFNLLEFN